MLAACISRSGVVGQAEVSRRKVRNHKLCSGLCSCDDFAPSSVSACAAFSISMATSRLLGHSTRGLRARSPLTANNFSRSSPRFAAMASTQSGISKIKVQSPIVEMDGDEMTRQVCSRTEIHCDLS